MPWNFSLNGIVWWCGTDCDAKFFSSTPLFYRSFPETSVTSRRVSYELHERQSVLNGHGQKSLHHSQCPLQLRQKLCQPHEETVPRSVTNNGPLDFIPMHILGLLLKMVAGNQFIIVITDRYIKEDWVIPSSKASARQVASIFFDHWIVPYGIPVSLLTDNGLQFVRKLFETVYTFLGVKHFAAAAYIPQTNGKV